MVSDRWSNKQEICDVYNAPVEIKQIGYREVSSPLLITKVNSVLEWAKFLNYCKGFVANIEDYPNSSSNDDFVSKKNFFMCGAIVLYWHNHNKRYTSPLQIHSNLLWGDYKIAWCMLQKYNFFKVHPFLESRGYWGIGKDFEATTDIKNLLGE